MSRVEIPVFEAGSTIADEDWVGGGHETGYKMLNDGKTVLLVTGHDEFGVSVSLISTYQRDGLLLEPRVVDGLNFPEKLAGELENVHFFELLRPSLFNVRSGDDKGYVHIDCANNAVRFAAYKVA